MSYIHSILRLCTSVKDIALCGCFRTEYVEELTAAMPVSLERLWPAYSLHHFAGSIINGASAKEILFADWGHEKTAVWSYMRECWYETLRRLYRHWDAFERAIRRELDTAPTATLEEIGVHYAEEPSEADLVARAVPCKYRRPTYNPRYTQVDEWVYRPIPPGGDRLAILHAEWEHEHDNVAVGSVKAYDFRSQCRLGPKFL
ncbi:hypothetical protein GLOTRDRAFT_129683 [Gloeophyllum trabeum ATCC 11539]|uniref:Uncharacterized protein n=1 Tax=Gloeophyllum trabeum (strain ATCC 11539 / FP-39264 / Madison 617) TaxID=670483 RepID=S7RR61_GLOTA|nr:uncharacterized protein GLOTRDRAFT_129683 [Gloeophyllum trabeum ATCC 11539]EPQ55409.1 hypothetical protein GLOTRDRAFT_129683 [Gloeophyllum trabeum ATCC 11539]